MRIRISWGQRRGRHVDLMGSRGANLALLGCLALGGAACGGGGTVVEPPAPRAPVCQTPQAGTYGVSRITDKSGKSIELNASDDLLMHEMVATGCFNLVERDREFLQVLFEEIDRCDPANPDRGRWDCTTFAKKGKLLGFTHVVFGSIMYYEPNASGAELTARFPTIGGVSIGRSYSALALQLRSVLVETAEVQKATVVHAVVPSDQAGLAADASGFQFKAIASSTTPMGKALQSMLSEGVLRLRAAGAEPANGKP